MMFAFFIITATAISQSTGQCFESNRVKRQQPTEPPNTSRNKISWNGSSATLTWFDDYNVQCYTNGQIPSGYTFAVNPLLLGYTTRDFDTKYSNVQPNMIPWCGKTLKLTVNGKTISGLIVDTCDPIGKGAAPCDYKNAIDLRGKIGRQFLLNTVGDDFYQGNLQWEIFNCAFASGASLFTLLGSMMALFL